jgi:hypothetical protein
MVPGFNHNVKYRGRVFHCQTEDSGISNPHIITHLFVGGNILATKKTSYADIVKSDRLEEVVVDLMQEQHKELLKKLLSGQFDDAIEERGANASHLNGPAPLNVEAGAQNRASMLAPAQQAPAQKPVAPKPPAAVVAAPAKPPAAVVKKPEIAVPKPVPQKPPPAPLPQEILDAQALKVVPQLKPSATAETIFGEDLISEKSLDEVILSYLAQEADR